MAQAKRKNSTKNAARQAQPAKAHQCSKERSCQKQAKEAQAPNTFFLISMSVLAGCLLVINLLMLNI